MPLVLASVCSIIAVPKVNDCTINSEPMLLPLYYKIDELQSSKKRYRIGSLKVKYFFSCALFKCILTPAFLEFLLMMGPTLYYKLESKF